MASIYKRKTKAGQKASPYFWIKYRDMRTGLTVRKSTKITHPGQAERMRLQYTLEEQSAGPLRDIEIWANWVQQYLKGRYGIRSLRAENAWRNIDMFLKEFKIVAPRQVIRPHGQQYLAWRLKPNKTIRKYSACRNTAIFELKFWAIVMDEAVQRGYAPANPLLKLKLKRDPVKKKPEYTRQQMARILWEIRKVEDPVRKRFFEISFLIARYHGVRLAETHLNPMTQVQLQDRPTITFYAKRDKIHTVTLHPKLVGRFRHMQAKRLTETYEPVKSPSKEWFNLLLRIGIKEESPGACFHSHRVTVATTLARNNISKKKAMDYIGHASTTVHDTYVRLKPDDLDECAAVL